jgi:putative transposase
MLGLPLVLYIGLHSMTSNLRKERHSVSDLKVHLVCVTKYRVSVFTSESLALIEQSFKDVATKMDFQILEFNGEADHVHALIEYPPKLSISQIVNSLKGVSSRQYGSCGYTKPYSKDALWSPSYFVSSVGGAPIEILKKYIQNQLKPS